jgi:hypothetical protein
LPQLVSTIKIKKVKKSCQKIVKKLSKSCQKFRFTWKNPKKPVRRRRTTLYLVQTRCNGAIVEKKKCNGAIEKKCTVWRRRRIGRRRLVLPRPGADYVAPGKNVFYVYLNEHQPFLVACGRV